ncbi:c-type cytochrome domain-containing protein [Verrucomicrobium spinosum]|uniref:c-type cytochrome domain-containing protein n=1 Tax=Verrucomicrobium spinosum TaxID=2736 RepID=UPI0009467A76|nr:c-type cytochrome domain-containing protein [Verrucomicrobium spinosum]
MNKVTSIASVLLATSLPLWPGSASARAAEITPEGRDYFEAHIRPVLVAECYDCHAGSKKKGGLVVDSREGLHKGGENGPSLIPGDAQNSLLIQTLAHTHKDPDLHMPKDGAKLDASALKHFVEWVNMGAPDPREKPAVAEGLNRCRGSRSLLCVSNGGVFSQSTATWCPRQGRPGIRWTGSFRPGSQSMACSQRRPRTAAC